MPEIPFATVLKALGDTSRAFPSRFIERFSDLEPADVQALKRVWPQVPLERRRSLVKKLVEHFDEDTLLSFEALAPDLLDDPDSQVRISALQLLSESTDLHLIPRLIQLLAADPEPAVCAAAARILSNFVHLGELEETPPAFLKPLTDALLVAAVSPEGHLARTALEALGYARRPEVPTLIENAFSHHDPHWQAAALIAAKNSADTRWQEQIFTALVSEDQPVRLAAVEAAGELELKPARQLLLNLLEDEEDDEVIQAAIWSLSLIGGEDVRTYLQTILDETDDDDLIEFIEDALLNLSFTEDSENFDLLAFDEDDPETIKKKRKTD